MSQRHLDECAECRELFSELHRDVNVSGESDGSLPVWIEKSAAELVRPGAVIDRYEILHQLGAGSMSIVFAARDRKLERDVAIKFVRVMSDSLDLADTLKNLLLGEAQVLARLSNVNVVTVYDVSVLGRWVYLVMELVDGHTLKEWLANVEPSRPEQLDAFGQIARGLSDAHEAGIIHRDIKPSNILVDGDGRAKLSDFGLARVHGDSAVHLGPNDGPRAHGAASTETPEWTHELVGTPAYMAPEVAGGLRASPRSDQFSFWLCVAEALTGQRPNQRDNFRVDSRLPRRLRRVIERGLSEDPEARYPSMSEAWSAFLRAHRPRKLRLGFVVAAGAAVGVAAWLSLSFYNRLQSERACESSSLRVESALDAFSQRAVVDAPRALRRRFRDHSTKVATHWQTGHRDACLAMKRNPENQLARARYDCNELELAGIVGLFAAVPQPVADKPRTAAVNDVIDALEGYPSYRCEQLDAQRAKHYVIPQARYDEVLNLSTLLTKSTHVAAETPSDLSIFTDIVDRARELGYLPILVDALRSEAEFSKRGWAEEGGLAEAAAHAATMGDRHRVAITMIDGVFATLNLLRPNAAAELFAAAKREVERAGNTPFLRAQLYDVNAGVLLHQGKLFEALAAARLARQAAAQYGRRTELYLSTTYALADLLIQAGKVDAAKELSEEMYTLAGQRYSPSSSTYVDIAIAHANVLGLHGDPDQAAEIIESSLQALESMDVGDEILARRYQFAARSLLNIGEAQRAEGYGRRALDYARRTEEKDLILHVLDVVLAIYTDVRPDDATVALALEAQALAEELAGKHSNAYFDTVRRLAALYTMMDRQREALQEYERLEKLVTDNEQSLPKRAVAITGQCFALFELRHKSAALTKCSQAKKAFSALGVGEAADPTRQRILTRLTRLLLDQKEIAEARAVFDIAKTMKAEKQHFFTFTQARLLWHEGQRKRARQLVRALERDEEYTDNRADYRRWLRVPY